MKDIQKLYELYSVDIYKFILSLSKDTYIAEDVEVSAKEARDGCPVDAIDID